jgi:hypothetical protein
MDTNYIDDEGAIAISTMILAQQNFTELYLCNAIIRLQQYRR